MNWKTEDLGKLLLRLTIGVLLILHGLHKIFAGPNEIIEIVTANHWPAFTAYGVYLGEVLGPLLVIFGFFTRIGGLLIFIDLIIAVILTRGGHVWSLDGSGGWTIQLEALFGLGGLAIALLGAGKYSVTGATGKFN
ncbi:MAG: DoxX family protein [Gammaproteobacteria bacterium]|nr:DoxX family protein [Gammaproteobacteria bacterium]